MRTKGLAKVKVMKISMLDAKTIKQVTYTWESERKKKKNEIN